MLRQIAQFEPRGLVGLLYWYFLLPVHIIIFRKMLKRTSASALHPGRQAEPMPALQPSKESSRGQ